MSALVTLVFLAIIRIIIFPVLDERDLQFFALRTAWPDSIAPLDPMRITKNIHIISAPPYEEQWFKSKWVFGIVSNDWLKPPWHVYEFRRFLCLWRDEQLLLDISVRPYPCIATRLPIHLESHSPCGGASAIPPDRLHSKPPYFHFIFWWNEDRGSSSLEAHAVCFRRQLFIETVHEYKGSLRSLKLDLCKSNGIAADIPKRIGEPSDSKASNYSEESIVPIDEAESTNRFPPDDLSGPVTDNEETGAIIAILVAVIGVIISYAILKRVNK